MNNRLETIIDLKQYPIQDLNSPLMKELIKKFKSDLDQFSCATIPNFILPKSLNLLPYKIKRNIMVYHQCSKNNFYTVKKNYIRNKIKSENFVLLNGDAIFDFNLSKILNKHKKNNFDITFLGCSAPLNYGIVGIKNKKIISF